MSSIKQSAAHMSTGVQGAWERLSTTQRLMARGIGVLGAVTVLGAAVGVWAPRAIASGDAATYTGTAIRSRFQELRRTLDTTRGELEIVRIRLHRSEGILRYSSTYGVPADLASLIYDTALREGLDPELAFRLVNIESGFKVKAQSRAGAFGLAQVQPATARFYRAQITTEELFDPETNLSIGFRYLSDLLDVYGDTKLALLAYNRGPSRLKELLDQGRDPGNGYASSVMEGYPGM